MKVKLGEIAREYKTKAESKKFSVGLEHIESKEIVLKSFEENANNTFTKGFKKGHVLFGRRRAYLQKACLAPFDGVCSGDIIVIEAIKSKVNPDLLPFIIQNDELFAYAVEKSAGSLSPRVKWDVLKEYEFDLPSLEEQERLAKVLWKIEESKTQASDSIKKINNLIQVTSKKDYESFCQFDLKKIKELLEVQKKSGIKAGESLSKGEYIFFTSGSSNAWCNKYLLDGEYLIFNTGGSMLIQYYNGKFSYSTDTMVIKCKDNLTKYLFYYLSSINDELDYNFFRGSGLRHLNKKEFFNMDIKIPSKEKIDDFVNKLENLNSIKKQLLIDLKDKSFLQKQILKEAFNV